MYDYVRGAVVTRGDGAVVLEAGGVGYRLLVSSSTLRQVPASGEMKLFTHMLVRDDSHELCGFADEGERHLFRQLLQVTGVGPAVALGLLSAHEPPVLASHIAAGELQHLTQVKGIGKRTGERILVELRDRLAKDAGVRGTPSVPIGVRGDAVLALCSLGLPRGDAERRVAAVKGDDLRLEDIVKVALRHA